MKTTSLVALLIIAMQFTGYSQDSKANAPATSNTTTNVKPTDVPAGYEVVESLFHKGKKPGEDLDAALGKAASDKAVMGVMVLPPPGGIAFTVSEITWHPQLVKAGEKVWVFFPSLYHANGVAVKVYGKEVWKPEQTTGDGILSPEIEIPEKADGAGENPIISISVGGSGIRVQGIDSIKGGVTDILILRKTPSATSIEKAETSDGINLRCGDISYKLSVIGQGASGASDYKDNDIAISFTARSGTATSSSGAQDIQTLLVCTISNVSPSTVVVHWGSDDKQYIVDSVPQVMQVLQLHYNPFAGGQIVELKTDMDIEPRQSDWVFVTALSLHNGLQQEILPSDPAEAERLKGRSVKLTLPLAINGKETKRTVEFTVNAVVNTGRSASPSIAPTK